MGMVTSPGEGKAMSAYIAELTGLYATLRKINAVCHMLGKIENKVKRRN